MCCFSVQIKKRKKKNIIKNENYEYKAIVQRTQSDHDRYMYDNNHRSAESISNNEIIERKENFSFIKFSNEEFSNTRHLKKSKNNINVANSAPRRRN